METLLARFVGMRSIATWQQHMHLSRHLVARQRARAIVMPCVSSMPLGQWQVRTAGTARIAQDVKQESDSHSKVLVRDFVFHSLYAPGIGYFQQQEDVVGRVGQPSLAAHESQATSESGSGVSRGRVDCAEARASGLDFKGMFGEMEYRHTVSKLYEVGKQNTISYMLVI